MTSHESPVFTSWKEIASYLGKGVRTVQRWEAQFGLPVQRPNARSKGIVRASREDLDLWVATRWSSRSMKLEIPIALAPGKKTTVVKGIESMHELRATHRLLLDQLHACLGTLSKSCQVLALSLAESRAQLVGVGLSGVPREERTLGVHNIQPTTPPEKTRAN